MNLALILLKTEPAHPLFDAVPEIGNSETETGIDDISSFSGPSFLPILWRIQFRILPAGMNIWSFR